MPRKTLQQRKDKSRVEPIVKKLIGIESADDLMLELLNILKESKDPPKEGKYYIFVYNAKTPNIMYDQNPLVAVTDVYKWGFKGFNYHWEEVRQYTWDEVAGGLYEVYSYEIEDLRRIPFSNIRSK